MLIAQGDLLVEYQNPDEKQDLPKDNRILEIYHGHHGSQEYHHELFRLLSAMNHESCTARPIKGQPDWLSQTIRFRDCGLNGYTITEVFANAGLRF